MGFDKTWDDKPEYTIKTAPDEIIQSVDPASLRGTKANKKWTFITLVDGDSDDDSMEPGRLRQLGVNSLLVITERGLGNALRVGFAYALAKGYQGIITVDGNGKDGVQAMSRIIDRLDSGYDLVQASRFHRDGNQENTPWDRLLGIKLVIRPLMKISSVHSGSAGQKARAFRNSIGRQAR